VLHSRIDNVVQRYWADFSDALDLPGWILHQVFQTDAKNVFV
jgi:hypothetical protein